MTQKPTLTREQHRILIEHLLDDSTFSQLAKDQIAELGRGYLAYLDMVPRSLKDIAENELVILPVEDGFEIARHYKNGWKTHVMGYSLDEERKGIPLSALPTPEGET